MRDPHWTVRDTQKPDAALAEHLGNKLLLGNGFVGVRGTLDEYGRAEKVAIIPAGLYDQQPGKWREPVNLPNPLFLQVSSAGTALHAMSTPTESHLHGLDLRRGVSFRETVFLPDGPRGMSVLVRGERFAALGHPNLLASRITITTSRDVVLDIAAGVDADVWDLNGPHLAPPRFERSDGAVALFSRTLEQGVPVVSAALVAAEGAQPLASEGGGRLRFRHQASAGKPLTLQVFAYVGHGQGEPGQLPEVRERLGAFAARGFDAVLEEHSRAWQRLWDESDVVIGGDDEAQHALRYSLYHLLAIAPYHTRDTSIPARGLSGQVYKGAVFWDTELFMLPFFAHTQPAMARRLLEYRVAGLPGARDKAREYGHEGAFYAWESQEGGRDACTHFNVSNVFTGRPTRTFFRDKQIHISSDVALAMREYVKATGDLSLLADGGAEVIYECARFLASWAYYQPHKQRYELLDVTGPDEYHERVHNDYYTNVLAAHTLDSALWVYETLEAAAPGQHRDILARTGFAALLPTIRDMAAKLFVPCPEADSGLLPQFDRYFTLEDVSLAELAARKRHPNEYLGGGEGLAVWTQVLKQADVVLALSLFADRYPSELKKKNWQYYEPRTEHGSSLSACSYAIVAAEIGELDFAYRYFMKTATVDLTGQSKQYVGDLYIGGTHPAANGGAWLSVVRGFCGISNGEGEVRIAPRLPAHWQQVVVRYRFGGNAYELAVSHDGVDITTLEQTRPHPRFLVAGRSVTPAT
jgi:nigerose phosphorylase